MSEAYKRAQYRSDLLFHKEVCENLVRVSQCDPSFESGKNIKDILYKRFQSVAEYYGFKKLEEALAFMLENDKTFSKDDNLFSDRNVILASLSTQSPRRRVLSGPVGQPLPK